jgi:hypothetical protein
VTASYPEFRRNLDEVLRRRDPAALRAFLIAAGQWTPETTTDPERAMWMMIATSPALSALHEEAARWLLDHGYGEEARLLSGKDAQPPSRQRPPRPRRPAAGRDSHPHHSPSRPRERGKQ